ncbi:4861_t:CDS:1, partial [Diversispora eburnea]
FSLNKIGLTELNNQDEQKQKNKQKLQIASSNNLESALNITTKLEKTKSSLLIKKNNEELLAEILTTNDAVKETF